MSKRKLDNSEAGKSEDGPGPPKAQTPATPDRYASLETTSPQLQTTTTPIRTSARVLKKKEEVEKRESEISESCSNALSDQVGLNTNQQKDSVVLNSPTAPKATSQSGYCASPTPGSKPRRTWEQWSSDDKRIFFEALNEYGKNFLSIEEYFQTKLKKKNAQAGMPYKTKEQIRTFYYRTWSQVRKYLTFPEYLKKSAQELYGLINFGELSKKVSLDERNGAKLRELVFSGHTTVRIKGKSYRLKTPVCRALKRLRHKLIDSNSKGDSQKSLTTPILPDNVTIELKPLTGYDFYRVHSLAFQNPHVHLNSNLNCKVGDIIAHLEQKWTSTDLKVKSTIKKTVSDANNIEDSEVKENPINLFLTALPGTQIRSPIIRSTEPITSTTLSLSFIESKISGENSSQEREQQKNEKSVQNDHAEIINEEDSKKETVNNFGSSKETNVDKEDETSKNKLTGTEWDKSRSEDMTVGELFLMIGSLDDNKIEMCYTWKQPLKAEEKISDSDLEAPQRKFCTSIFSSIRRLASLELQKRQNTNRTSSNANGQFNAQKNAEPATQSSGNQSLAQVPTTTESAVSSVKNTIVTKGSEKKVEFARPEVPPIRIVPLAPGPQSGQSQAFKQQVSRLLPKYTNRRGRSLTRKSVISRHLSTNRPLRPSPVIETSNSFKMRLSRDTSANIVTPVPIVTFSNAIQSNNSQFVKISPEVNFGNNSGLTFLIPQNSQQAISTNANQIANMTTIGPSSTASTGILRSSTIEEIPQISIPEISEQSKTSPPRIERGAVSPAPSISSLFNDNSMSDLTSTKADQFLDSVLENSNSSMLRTPPRQRTTPPSSPPTKDLNSEVWLPELSLSSFLNLSGDSPSKFQGTGDDSKARDITPSSRNSLCLLNEDSSHSTNSEVDRQLMSMMSENSVDFQSRFAKLASHVSENEYS